ncbi:hypothetical protein G5714_002575 [Onychostoma macrolepis]|uniref:Integrase core domain-containing protein n=1 Tax=Onychostoma macrolepis TaxID=369639 RepID=A0A7J6D746_9TELE|nr:hypothetical protein G5714_002575 [Onychostoma macrolepis]
MAQHGLRVSDLFSTLEDAELDALVEDVLKRHPLKRVQSKAGFELLHISIPGSWRDVYAGVLDLFYTIFTNLENDGLLNPDDEVHLYALQRCFLPHVQKHLQYFQDGWNHHKLRTEGNQSPIQLWLSHQLQDPIQIDAMQYGIDWRGPCGHHEPRVVIPKGQIQLTQEDAERFPDPDVPLSNVSEVYRETVMLLYEMLE